MLNHKAVKNTINKQTIETFKITSKLKISENQLTKLNPMHLKHAFSLKKIKKNCIFPCGNIGCKSPS